jgi:SAM-dependent methyltransferase
LAAGKDIGHLQPADLDDFEDFHTLGRIATRQLAELAKISSDDKVLDAGSGIGGTSRFLADQYSCSVTAIDLTEEFCETASWLNRLVGLQDRISVLQGDVTDLPFAKGMFQVVVSQHVQMNVDDKSRLYQEARRVLGATGRLAIWDIVCDKVGTLDYPLPWADRSELSHLVTAGQLRALIDSSGFEIIHWKDVTEQAGVFMAQFLSAPSGPLGLHTFIDAFAEKADNLTRGLISGHLGLIQGIARTERS